MNQKDENCPAFQMVHLSLLTLIYCKEQNGRKLANKNFTTLAIQQKKKPTQNRLFSIFVTKMVICLDKMILLYHVLLSYNKLQ